MSKEYLGPPDELIIQGKTYRHYKGKLYKVHGIVRHSETLEEMVYYECLYENKMGQLWVRPLDNFLGAVEIEGKTLPRFKLED